MNPQEPWVMGSRVPDHRPVPREGEPVEPDHAEPVGEVIPLYPMVALRRLLRRPQPRLISR